AGSSARHTRDARNSFNRVLTVTSPLKAQERADAREGFAEDVAPRIELRADEEVLAPAPAVAHVEQICTLVVGRRVVLVVERAVSGFDLPARRERPHDPRHHAASAD